MKVFVTGAEGFIGSHLVEKLVEKKYKVTAHYLYNFSDSMGWINSVKGNLLNKVKIVKGDIRDIQLIRRLIKGNDIVINLAALIGIPYSYTAIKSYYDMKSSAIDVISILFTAFIGFVMAVCLF